MKLEELKELWETNVKVVFKNGDVAIGFFCSFERAEDEPSGRDNITISTEYGSLVCIYLDEIKTITKN